MQEAKGTTELPAHLRSYFWEYADDGLDWKRSKHTIVLRLLQSGGIDAVAWLRSQMNDNEIRDFIVRRQGRGIEPRRLRFWGLLLNVPRSDVDQWIAAAKANPWNRRVH